MSAPDPSTLPGSLVLAGAGKMGGAMLQGWLALGLRPDAVSVIDPHPSPAIADIAGLTINPTSAAQPPAILVLAIKPQMLDEAAPALAALVGPDTVIVSILAGKTVADIGRVLPGSAAIVRAMPNLPASIRRGVTGAYATPSISREQRAMVDTLLTGIGAVEWLDREDAIDIVTAVSGSGPAYLFHLVECLAQAGVAQGLDRALAARLAQGTVVGAAELLDRSGQDPATLRENVTSPGGTTAAALAVLMADDGLGRLMRDAVAAARERAGELSR